MDVKDLNSMTSAEIQEYARGIGSEVGEIINKAVVECNLKLKHLDAVIQVSYDLVPAPKDK